MTEEKLKYPIGKFIKPDRDSLTKELLEKYIAEIEIFPSRLRSEVENLTDEQLGAQYRPNGWTIRQVVNHCADSHINGFVRFKLTLTEEKPIVKPYFEERWAELIDSKAIPIEPALKMLEGLHQRWTILLKSLKEEQLKRSFIHPENEREISLEETISLYAWHGNHHLAHITTLKKIKNWI